jgi:hypothetical protein
MVSNFQASAATVVYILHNCYLSFAPFGLQQIISKDTTS